MSGTNTKPPRPTFDVLCKLEPRLLELKAAISAVKDDGGESGFCANYHWYYTPIGKSGVSRLVGWERKGGPAELRTMQAYEVATDALYNLLPDCRHEGWCA
jgi:hypothetical protein